MNLKYLKLLCFINGKTYQIKTISPFKLVDIIKFFHYNKNSIILEYNNKIYNINKYNKLSIKMKDSFEVLTIVGGG